MGLPPGQLHYVSEGIVAAMSHVVKRVQLAKLEAPLRNPFAIASTRLDRVRNVAVRVELESGAFGIGEAACLVPVTACSQGETMHRLEMAKEQLLGIAIDVHTWEEQVRKATDTCLHGWEAATARAAWECAIVDAMARARNETLWMQFERRRRRPKDRGRPKELKTCITVPIGEVKEGTDLATSYEGGGYAALKIKVGSASCDGKELSETEAAAEGVRAGRIAAAAPSMRVVVDANEAFGRNQQAAKTFLEAYQSQRHKFPWILEQPMLRTEVDRTKLLKDWATGAGVRIAVDEGCRTLEDAKRVVQSKEADVINVKLAKSGLIGALDIIDLALKSDVQLMLGGMVETRIGMGCAAHLAIGLGCFEVVDLDTPLLLSHDPVLWGPKLEHGAYWLEERGRGTDCDIMLDWEG